jgi:SH3 domain-containing YSC84-like protein 1
MARVRSVSISILVLLAASVVLLAQSDETHRLTESATVLSEIMSAQDNSIPRPIVERAEAIVVFPSTFKAGFIVAGHRGRGIVSARDHERGGWSPPAFLTLTGGSFGVQVGGEAVDLVLCVMNRHGLETLLRNQFKLGGDASVAAGPVGREAGAATDLQMRAEILSYSRARGVFAGLSIKGSSIRQDRDANERFYGYPFRTRDIVFDGKAKLPESAGSWIDALKRFAG